jgi:Tol biopolymer transport system component
MLRELTRVAAAICALIAGGSAVFAQTTTCANLKPNGFPSAGTSLSPSISADGRWLAFVSSASDLGAPSGSSLSVYLRDLATGAIALVSADPGGAAGAGSSTGPVISADGRWVAFTSAAPTLVAGDTNGVRDTFVRDVVNATTIRVSLSSTGMQATQDCTATSLSADGRYVAFETTDALVPTDANGVLDVYVHDRVTGATRRASVASTGTESAGNCYDGWLSADGNRVAFTGNSDDLVPGDANGYSDVFVHDFALGTTVIASVSSTSVLGDLGSLRAALSGDGNTVVFVSAATNLVAQALFPSHHAFARNLSAGTTDLVDADAAGVGGNGSIYSIYRFDVSHDGRFVAFSSSSSNLVAGDTNQVFDVFVKDRLNGAVVRASFGAVGQQIDEAHARWPAISDDGRFVAFFTDAENVLPADSNLNWDVFVRDLGGLPTGTAFCFGDGTGGACPCNNYGFFGRGCGHSNDPEGAEIFAMGRASVSADMLRLGGRELPSGTTCLFFQGTAQAAGLLGAPFGDGLRCVGGTVHRLATKSVSSLQETHFPGVGDAPISSVGAVPAIGGTRFYQIWYRNAATYCTPDTFNLTNAIQIDWTL